MPVRYVPGGLYLLLNVPCLRQAVAGNQRYEVACRRNPLFNSQSPFFSGPDTQVVNPNVYALCLSNSTTLWLLASYSRTIRKPPGTALRSDKPSS